MDLKTLEAVATVGSKLEKERLLKTVGPDTIKFLKWALDPMITFGVTVEQDSLIRTRGDNVLFSKLLGEDQYWHLVDDLCLKLSSRELTGNSATGEIEKILLGAPSTEHLVWAARILNKDLRAGFSMSTLNKAHPGCIEKEIPCSLAKPYDPEKHEIRGAWCVEPKLDGLRMVVVNGLAYTRNGRPIDSVGHILEELKILGNDYVWDGEIMGATGFDEDSGKIRKKGEGPNLSLVYNIFDCIWKSEWDARKTKPYNDRRMYMFEALGTLAPKYSRMVPLTLLTDPTTEQLFAARDEYIKMGFEGAMLKDMQSPYVFKRSDAILKLKTFVDADGKITDSFEGKGRHKGRLGGFIVEFDGVLTRVGGGFSDAERTYLWKNRGEIVGSMIEVKYQNKTEEGSLRFPVFVKFRPDKD